MSTRYDYTKWGTGLQSQGLSTNPADVYKFYQQVAANPSTAYNKGILSGIQAYGKNNKGSTSDPNYVTNALDWYWRDIQRKSQKENGFFDSTLGKVLGTVAQVGLGFVPGVGPALSAGLGATIGGIQGGFGGALLGGLGGYGSGQLGAGLSSAFSGAGGLSTLLKAPGTFASNLGRGALTSAQNYLPGFGGNLTSSLASSPSLFSNLFGGGGSTTSALSGVGSSGGGGMSFFGDLLKQSIPSLIGGGIQYIGNANALEAQQKAAQQLAAAGQFNPYNVSGPGGGAFFSGNNATATLSPELQAQLAQMSKATQGAFGDYSKFNAGDYSSNYYNTIKGYQQPIDQANTNELLNRVYATGNFGSTTGAQDVYSYQQAKNMEDSMLRIQAQQAGASEQDRLFTRYFNSAAQEQNLATLPYQFLSQGANFGGAASNANVAANQYPWLAAQNASDASSAFWSTIAGGVMNAGNSVMNKYGSYQKNANRPISFAPSPYFSGGNSTFNLYG
jgi:hypothetical protein